MKLALLGSDDDVLAIAAAAIAAGHVVDWVADVRPQDMAPLRELLPSITPAHSWEAALDHNLAHAVVFGQGSIDQDERCDRLRRLVADGVSTLVIHPVSTAVLPHFELDMAQQEGGGVLLHYSPLAGSGALQYLVAPLGAEQQTIGPIHRVAWQRSLLAHDREPVLRALARDVESLQVMMDGVSKVSATGPKNEDASFASLNVQLIGPHDRAVHWAVAPADGNAAVRVTYVGELGQIQLIIPHRDADWRQITSFAANEEIQTLAAPRSATQAIERLEGALNASDTADNQRVSWQAALHSMEVVDAVELSLQRQRMIDVYHQQLTEKLAFRGIMSAFGCGLLVFVVLVIMLAGVLGDLIGLPVARYWPFALVAILVFFLLLQLLTFTARAGKK